MEGLVQTLVFKEVMDVDLPAKSFPRMTYAACDAPVTVRISLTCGFHLELVEVADLMQRS